MGFLRIIVYRDGVSDSELEAAYQKEVRVSVCCRVHRPIREIMLYFNTSTLKMSSLKRLQRHRQEDHEMQGNVPFAQHRVPRRRLLLGVRGRPPEGDARLRVVVLSYALFNYHRSFIFCQVSRPPPSVRFDQS